MWTLTEAHHSKSTLDQIHANYLARRLSKCQIGMTRREEHGWNRPTTRIVRHEQGSRAPVTGSGLDQQAADMKAIACGVAAYHCSRRLSRRRRKRSKDFAQLGTDCLLPLPPFRRVVAKRGDRIVPRLELLQDFVKNRLANAAATLMFFRSERRMRNRAWLLKESDIVLLRRIAVAWLIGFQRRSRPRPQRSPHRGDFRGRRRD